MSYIKNRDQLLSHGLARVREMALDIIEYALAKADPYKATRDLVSLQNNILSVGELTFDLNNHQRIFLLGVGKATYPIAKALEDILGDRINGGVITCKYGQEGSLFHVDLHLASHPIPDESGLHAAMETMKMASQTQAGDIVFGCITGGSSALLPFPVESISLEEKKRVNQLLLTCGANIIEINAVRKHLSKIKGGRLAKAIHEKANLVNLTVSDVIGDPLDCITDLTVPDNSTLDDARATLNKYDLWDKLPSPVSQFLKEAGPEDETPKEHDLAKLHRCDYIIVKSDAACEAAAEKAESLGLNTMVLSTMFEGESSELGRTFGAVAKEILQSHRPLKPPCIIIGGGETTVKIDGTAGEGGPNQEFALAAAQSIHNIEDIVVAGMDTDGTDGPTDLAGALIDGDTETRAHGLGIDLFESLKAHDVSPVLKKLEDAIETDSTGTNVNDLKFMIIAP